MVGVNNLWIRVIAAPRLYFHTAEFVDRLGITMDGNSRTAPKCAIVSAHAACSLAHCTRNCHTPVNELHSIDFAADKFAMFLLTLKIEGVKTQSFFDTFSVLPVGAASGTQAKSPDCESEKEGEQGSIAKRWSRRTGTTVEGKIESRGVELVCPVGGKPGARVKIVRCNPQGSDESRSGKGLTRATGRDE